MNVHELLGQRHRDYAKAQERHARALERRSAAEERVQALERELADAEDEDRRTLGDALVDERKPPARRADRVRVALKKAKAELEALQFAAERAGVTLDRMPSERKSKWLREALSHFQFARSDYEQQLSHLAEARERLTEEAALVNFLRGAKTVFFPNTVRGRRRGACARCPGRGCAGGAPQ
jgi:hypothetical protein